MVFVLLTHAAVPNSDGKGENGLSCSAVKLDQDGSNDLQFSQLSEKEKPMVGFLNRAADILMSFHVTRNGCAKKFLKF